MLAPGVEREDESGEQDFVFRVAVVYVFDVGPIGIAPTMIVDFVDAEEREQVYVYGVALEWEF